MTSTSFCKPFLDFMSTDVELDEESAQLISQYCRPVRLAKDQQVLTAGDHCKYVYFIVTGKAISYFVDFKGNTTTWFFHFNEPFGYVKNVFAVDYRSFLSGEPATISMKTTTEVEAIQFTREDIDHLMKNSLIFERWMRKLDEKSFIVTYDRLFTLLTLSATDRYIKFLDKEPYLLNMFSNYHIASYLGIKPQSLSRIRKSLTK